MDNEEIKNENDILPLGDSDTSEKLSAEDIEKFGADLKDFSEKPKAHSEPQAAGSDSDQPRRPRRPAGQPEGRRRPDARRPQGDPRRRPNGQRRPHPASDSQRPQGEGQRRRRPDGQRPVAEGQRRPRPNGQGSAAAGVKKKKGWTKKKKAALITIVSIVLTLALIVGVVLFLFFRYTGLLNRDPDTQVNSAAPPMDSSELVSKPDTISNEDQEAKLKEMLSKRSQPITDSNIMNILLIGEDLRDTTADGNSAPRGNTDVQMLVSINKQQKKIVLASFLRDQYVNIEGYGMGRLNSAYWHEGIPLLKDTIGKYYNVHIDRYVMVNFYSFMDIIDTLGGVDIEVTADESYAMEAALRLQNNLLNNPIDKDYPKKSGMLHLNGNQALAFSRIRDGVGDDYGRTERQRKMITEVMKKAKSLSLLELDSLINKVAPQITTDISNGEIASLLLNASDIMGYQICQVQMPHYPYFKEEVINQMAVLVPDYDKNCTILLDMIYGTSTTVEQAVEKMEKGEINQYTYTTGNGDQNGQDQNQNGQDQNGQNQYGGGQNQYGVQQNQY